MSAIPGMNEPAIIILCVLMACGGAMIYAMVSAIRHEHAWRRAGQDPESSPFLSAVLTVLLVIGCFLIIFPRDNPAHIAVAAPVAKPQPPQIVSLKDCPPPGPGLTDMLVMSIRSQADLRPAVTGCSRIAERSFGVRKKPIIAEAK